MAQEPFSAPAAIEPTPVEEASESQEEEPSTPAPVEPDVTIGGVPMVQSSSGSFHFMQESELEATPTVFEDGAEWVEHSAVDHPVEQQDGVPPPLDLEDTKLVNGHIEESLPEVIIENSLRLSSSLLTTIFFFHIAPPDRRDRLGS